MLYVPDSLSRKFEEAAAPNTRQNIETCAILAGKLVHMQPQHSIVQKFTKIDLNMNLLLLSTKAVV